MDPRMIPKNAPRGEYNFGEQDGTRRPNEAGVYYHKESGKFISSAVAVDPSGNPILRDGKPIYARDTGKIQGDAFVQLGYRPATEQELKEYEERKKESAARIEAARKAKARSV